VSARRSAYAAALLTTLAIAGTAGCAAAGAGTPAHHTATPAPAAATGDLTITSPYLPKPVDTSMAAAYFVVRDAGAADHLDRVTAPGFAREVRAHTTKNDKMIMVRGYDVPAHGTLTLARGGNHLMLMTLSRMPRPGQTVTLRLYFAKAGRVDVKVPVKAATYRPPDDDGGDGGMDHMGGGGHGAR